MNAKLMAEIFSDMIEASQRSTMAGESGREHRGYICINDEVIEALNFAKKQQLCKDIKFGSYECYQQTILGFDVDMCLSSEINSLNNQGIKTIGCCCGHAKKQGYIQVTPEHFDKMTKLGYESLPTKSENYATWCFKPKTILPNYPQSAEEYFYDNKIS